VPDGTCGSGVWPYQGRAMCEEPIHAVDCGATTIESIELGRERRVNARRGRRAAGQTFARLEEKPNASLTSSETALRSGFSRA
jgi:hypothetical protein